MLFFIGTVAKLKDFPQDCRKHDHYQNPSGNHDALNVHHRRGTYERCGSQLRRVWRCLNSAG